MLLGNSRRPIKRVLVVDPAGVDRGHVDAQLGSELGRGRARHHVERGLGHVPV